MTDKYDEAAEQVVNEWFATVDKDENGELSEYSCSTCELDCYLCPHRGAQLKSMIAAKMRNWKR